MFFLGKKISGIFTIPSGVITVEAKIIEKIANEIQEIGVITTKSIGLESRHGNREPILTQYSPGCFINAVGLANLGAREFARQLKLINIPQDKFLLCSIFGKDIDEFVKTAIILAPCVDGLELNLSCPHTKDYGLAVGQRANLVFEIVSAVKLVINKPIVVKLAPVFNIAEIANAAVKGGADAICAINTVGPGYYTIDSYHVLSNQKGGISGKGILPIGLRCVKEISEIVDIPIIGCGGISNVHDVKAYQQAGASIFGIGSALASMSLSKLKKYFFVLNKDLENNSNDAVKLLEKADMSFKQYDLKENKRLADDLSLLVFDRHIEIKLGQFVFAWIPGIGEKPFSVLDDSPLTLAVQKRGCFSERLINLKTGNKVYFRGPYGNSVKIDNIFKFILVSGGTGIVALYKIAKEFFYYSPYIEVFIGAKDKNHLFYIDEFRKIAKVYITTEDGSEGYKGFVTDLLKSKLYKVSDDIIFFNCGPAAMIEKAIDIEKQYVSKDKIYSSIDYITKCGVGLCGSCATKNGKRLCVDGPFIKEE